MYLEKRYEETRVEALHALMRDHPLANPMLADAADMATLVEKAAK